LFFASKETDMNDIHTSTSTLLSVILGKRRAKRLYRGSLVELFLGGSLPEDAKMRLSASRELVRRWMLEELQHGPILGDPKGVRDYLRVHFSGMEREVFLCLFLDQKYQLISAEELFLGTIDMANVYPREVLKRALQLNASSVILAHNHPSGVADASHADAFMTERLKEALAFVEIRCLDHLIVGGSTVTSLAEKGLI
jgi:DNA repair protein RadC